MSIESHQAGVIVRAKCHDQTIYFFVSNILDVIQNCHLNGTFYEVEELEMIRRYFQAGQVFLDIGSNVGNHAIYVEKFLQPKSVVVVEPNPHAIAILMINLALNRSQKTDTQYLGIGLSDREEAVVIEIPPNNLGGARLRSQQGSGIRVVRGDNLFRQETIDFIKIDVEGLELEVLQGLDRTLSLNRPKIFIEVSNENVPRFGEWLKSRNYRAIERYRRYATCENYLIAPE
jgi:FkbM family methyltransferase